jgi:subtilisin family serine protease
VTGAATALTAPGVEIVSTGSRAAGATSGYVGSNGTSDATAIVSGAAALIRAKFPSLKAPDVINRLIRTADDAGPPGRDSGYGFGELDITRALTANVPSVSSNPLGNPAAPSQGVPSSGGDETEAAAAPVGRILAIAGIVVCLLVVALIVVIIAVVSSRSRRRKAAAVAAQGQPGYPPPYPPQQQGYPPPAQGYPPPANPYQGYPQQGGYPPQPGYPPQQGYPQDPNRR